MAKQIFISSNDIENILQEVKEKITGVKSFGRIDIQKDFAKDERDAVIYFTADAWNKLTALVREFDTEVQWHGCVTRLSENEYVIYDIIVPPHVVTGSTVISEFTKYAEWINGLEDNVFNSLHFHGHSHVNMACNPSKTDTKYRQDLVTQLPLPKEDGEDSFYIFLIFNKRGEWTGEIYDLTYNALYETRDISIEVYCGNGDMISKFIEDAKKMAVKETPKPATTYAGNPSYAGCSGYSIYGTAAPKKKAKKGKGECYTGVQQLPAGQWPSSQHEDDDEDNPHSPFYSRSW